MHGQSEWGLVDRGGDQSVVTTIRATAATNPIIIAGLNWSNDLSQWLNFVPSDSAHAIIAGAHNYFDNLGCQDTTCWNTVWENIQNNGYPVLIDEFGQLHLCDHSQIDILMNWADSVNLPFIANATSSFLPINRRHTSCMVSL